MDRSQRAAEARLIAASHAREVSDFARGVVGGTSSAATAADRIGEARRLRLLALQVLNWSVRAAVLEGTPWVEIATALGRDAEAVRAEFEAGTSQWADLASRDPERAERSAAEAEALDTWYRTHAVDFLDPAEDAPVSGLFAPPKE
ncbi:hypothetical protein OHS33_38615 (plasmid) [Streptomyces sp. NBC_00536]|uniref:hypothetical protein n=1 Tax=Streptomyces sp. NBC_00536 TaxID=2975769 RepID=UPI002E819555|nr:hypothetical protein [Streptomyces sp. NBC_00536]WUC84416.1 hypothetical protein OHS33_38615 [Streptomyces sp. NBC_00536]